MTTLDQWHMQQLVQNLSNEAGIVSAQMTRPSVLYRPEVGPLKDGTGVYAQYHGIYVTGETPEAAMDKFDMVWRMKRE